MHKAMLWRLLLVVGGAAAASGCEPESEADGSSDGGGTGSPGQCSQVAYQPLYDFNDASSINDWAVNPFGNFALHPTIAWNQMVGGNCAGSLQMNADIGVNVHEDARVERSYSGQAWAGKARLHFWVKITTGGDMSAIYGFQCYVKSGNGGALYGPQFVALADFEPLGQDCSVDLTVTANVDLDNITAIGLEVNTGSTPHEAANVIAYVDDIWLE